MATGWPQCSAIGALLVAVITACSSGNRPARGPARTAVYYSPEALPTLNAGSGNANAINGVGDIVGAISGSSGEMTACVWSKGRLRMLQVPVGFAGSNAMAVSNGGVIVGDAFAVDSKGTSQMRAVAWHGTAARLLPTPELFRVCGADGVSGSGVLVGGGSRNLVSTGFPLEWRNGRVQVLPTPANDGGEADGVSDSGVVVGGVISDIPARGMYTRPAEWVGGRLKLLPMPAGFIRGKAKGVNRVGDVTGWISKGKDVFESRPCLWIRAAVHVLSLPVGATGGQAHGINGRGEIVGSFWDTKHSLRAFVWSARSGPYDLNRVAGGGQPDHPVYESANAIDNAGDIVADGAAVINRRAILGGYILHPKL